MKNFKILILFLMVMGISKFAFSQTDTLKPYQIERIDVTAEYRGMKVIKRLIQ